MRTDNGLIHAPTVLLSQESNNREIKTFFFFFFLFFLRPPELHRWHPGVSPTPFYDRAVCSVGSARPSLLDLFSLKVAPLVKKASVQCACVCMRASLLRVSGAEKDNMFVFFFFLLPSIDYCC